MKHEWMRWRVVAARQMGLACLHLDHWSEFSLTEWVSNAVIRFVGSMWIEKTVWVWWSAPGNFFGRFACAVVLPLPARVEFQLKKHSALFFWGLRRRAHSWFFSRPVCGMRSCRVFNHFSKSDSGKFYVQFIDGSKIQVLQSVGCQWHFTVFMHHVQPPKRNTTSKRLMVRMHFARDVHGSHKLHPQLVYKWFPRHLLSERPLWTALRPGRRNRLCFGRLLRSVGQHNIDKWLAPWHETLHWM